MIISNAHVVEEDHSDVAPIVDEDPNDAVSQDDDESSEEAGDTTAPSSSWGKRYCVASLSSLVTHLDTLSAAICRLEEIVQTSHTHILTLGELHVLRLHKLPLFTAFIWLKKTALKCFKS